MRLKSLEMQGFKSFPDKTVLNFDNGLTAVVGPNGSGKSNISDAMRWVLGEVSSRSIRGTKMEDVIFSGTDNRRPMGFCEVSLTIDNTDKENRMNIDFDEVTVTRRYYRNGDSEYFINHAPVRLKDINELFMNTGIGRSGYSMVGQGKAAEIISQKSDERRIIFEEAAGIAKYRYKKNEAERKLAGVEDNLIRIGDIIGELESRVGPLEKESEKAKKYLELYDKKKTAEVALSIFDISKIKRDQIKLESDYSISSRELEAVDSDIAVNEQQSDKLYEEVQADKLRYEELFRLSGEANEERLKIESSGKVYENEIFHITEQRSDAEKKLESLRSESEERTASKNKAADDLESEKDRLSAAVSDHERITKLIAEKDTEIDSVSEKIEQIERRLNDLNEELIDKRIERSTLEVSDRSGDERKASLLEENLGLSAESDALTNHINQAVETIGGYNENADSINKIIENRQAEEDRLINELVRLGDKVNALTVEINSQEHRAQTLSRMEAQLDGYSNAVRRVMSASENGELSGICGPVSRIITTEPKYSTAIESALGASMQNIVTENESDAKKAIRYLRDNKAGRATFYPVSTIKPSYLRPSDFNIASYKGYVGMAHELARCSNEFNGIKDYLLSRTAVFDDLDNANTMARASGFKVRAVTLDGQLINTGGSFTGGSAIRESGMLTRQNEIKSINGKIKKLREELESVSGERKSAEDSVSEIRNEIADLSARKALFSSLISAESAQKKMLEAQLVSIKERSSTLSIAIGDIDNDINKAKEAYKNASDRIDEISAEIASLNIENEKEKQNRRSLSEAQEVLRRELNEAYLHIAESRKDTEAAEKSLYDAEVRLSETEAAIADTEQTLKTCDEKLAEFAQKIDQGVVVSEDLANKLKSYEEESRRISERNLANEAIQTSLREKSKELSHTRELILRTYTKLEADINASASELDKLTSRLWEEYELTYSSALALDLPEVTEENRKAYSSDVAELRAKIRQMGSVNVGAIEEFSEVKRTLRLYERSVRRPQHRA